MGIVADHLSKATRRFPAVIGGVLDRGQIEIEAFGAIAHEPEPEQLAWEIGSITKVFTGILLAEMSIRGEVDLDDPIGAYVPDQVRARLPEADRQPTLSDLATHTAGLPRLPRQWVKRIGKDPDPYRRISAQDVWDVLGPDTVRPSRRRPRYSNLGMGLLGMLLGRAAEGSYEALVTERILEPLEMGSTGFGARPVQGYRKGEPTPPWTFEVLGAAGGLRSTMEDMLRFARACVFPPKGALGSAIKLSRKPVDERRILTIGLGWQIRKRPGRGMDALWHNGGTYGGSSFLATHPTQEVAAVTFANAGPRLIPWLDGPSWRLYESLGSR